MNVARIRNRARRHHTSRGQAFQRDALARWDWEGGVAGDAAALPTTAPLLRAHVWEVVDTEMAQLRMRVVALEHLVLALLVHGSVGQRAAAGAMAAYILPRPGFTAHPLTIRAAARMAQLVGRASALHGGAAVLS